MFQVEPILWLQAHATPLLTRLLSGVTLLGYAPAYGVAVLALAVFFRVRAALAVALAVLLGAGLAEGLKHVVAFPRPSDVDARVVVPEGAPVHVLPAAVQRGGGASFWSLPSRAAIAAVRSRPHPSLGFPSGHVASALVFVLAAGYFCRFRRGVAVAAALVWPLLMALSRLYLGRHFLADVLAGAALGATAFATAALLLRRLRLPPAD